MTDHPTHDYDGQAVSNRLGRHQHTLDDSLDSVLDIEAGLREILIHSRHDTAVNALGTVLNTEAGLAGILPPSPQPHASSDTSGTHRHPRAGDFLPALSPADRMALRKHPDVKAAQRALARTLDRARDLPLDLARDLALALACDLDRTLDRDRDLDLDLARARARARDLPRALDLARARELDLDHARTLDHARARARDLDHARDLALDLARDLDRDLDHARDLARTLAHDLDLARDLDLDLDRDLDAFIEIRTNEVCRAIGSVLHQEPPVLDAASVPTLLDDFTDDDLRDTDLRGIDFSGVHWSQRTQWPPVVDIEALKARSDETPPGSGIWIVRSGTTTVRGYADLT
ncbi:hypothetical protein ACF08M_41560 [Streptomyces sp. NPDC015032]|uniref:hypothetical protein n=1 Tax=Streptomyces sp. NPDC015032 TaxID=3364937 RepID=UPI003701E8D8